MSSSLLPVGAHDSVARREYKKRKEEKINGHTVLCTISRVAPTVLHHARHSSLALIARLRNVCYDESVRSLILAVVAVSDKARRFVIDL